MVFLLYKRNTPFNNILLPLLVLNGIGGASLIALQYSRTHMKQYSQAERNITYKSGPSET